MKVRKYNIGDLRKIIKESSNEFKPVLGSNVESDNKKINDKAYKDIAKDTKDYDGGVKKETKKINEQPANENKGMEDLKYLNMSPEFKSRVKSQIKGYTSADAEKNHKNDELGNAEFGTDEEYKKLADKAKDSKEAADKGKEIGLTSREIDKKKFKELNDTMFEERKMKKLTFKHTEFISENHMLTKIPDDFKVNGNKFIMKDNSDNEFIVEWKEDKANVSKQVNRTKLEEEKNKIKHLYNYKSKDFFNKTNNEMRLNEEKNFSDVLGRARSLMK